MICTQHEMIPITHTEVYVDFKCPNCDYRLRLTKKELRKKYPELWEEYIVALVGEILDE